MKAAQHHWVLGDGRAQQGLARIIVRPGAFVPACAEDPFALGHRSGALGNQRDCLGFGSNVGQVDGVELCPEFNHVRV